MKTEKKFKNQIEFLRQINEIISKILEIKRLENKPIPKFKSGGMLNYQTSSFCNCSYCGKYIIIDEAIEKGEKIICDLCASKIKPTEEGLRNSKLDLIIKKLNKIDNKL